jgi:hypothetical protein
MKFFDFMMTNVVVSGLLFLRGISTPGVKGGKSLLRVWPMILV